VLSLRTPQPGGEDMTKIFKLVLTLSILLAIHSQPFVATARQLSEPEKNFEHLWKTFDRNYALFGPKNIDWDALYKVYRPRVTAQTTDDELFDIMSSLLGHLNDNHVGLRTPKRSFQSGILGEMKMEDFSLSLIKEKYLKGKSAERVGNVYTYGWLTDSVGYFHFRGFGRLEESAAAVDEIVKEFKDAKGVVIDVRGNGGGDDRVGKAVADRFADRKRLYMKTRIRNGAGHSDCMSSRADPLSSRGPSYC
jgi:carboxyl-terminal processing protease